MPQPSAVSLTSSVCSAVIGVDHQAWLCCGNAILAALPWTGVQALAPPQH